MDKQRQYIAIDLKSFYASVECVDRGLDPLTTNLVVADASRTVKTICLAVTPSLKAYGISGRARLFEVVERVREVNEERLCFSPEGIFHGRSFHDPALQADDSLELDYIVATPRMSHYMKVSAKIYSIYLRFISPDDIHVYSIDEVFIDATNYLASYRLTARELATKMINEVLRETGITATAGIGTNLYLAKVAMDIVAKHCQPDSNGVRLAVLDEMAYRRQLWHHTPLTDFWRIGRGTARRLKNLGISTMGELARYSLDHEQQLYRTFGVNAELIVDHAWGWEPATIADIKSYRTMSTSVSNGQVLQHPYPATQARVVAREMANKLSDDLALRGLEANHLALYIGYDTTSLNNPDAAASYNGQTASDYYGRIVPVPAHATTRLKTYTSSTRIIGEAIEALFDSIDNPLLLVRRLNVAALNVARAGEKHPSPHQLSIFEDPDEVQRQQSEQQRIAERERRMQQAELAIKERFGKNSILRGTDFEEGATGRERNRQVGGHRS